MATGSTAVRVRGLVKQYTAGAPPALRGVDLDIEPGSFVSVMGPSGSGKSTLLHLLGGLDRPDAGEIHVGDRSLTRLDDRALTELRRTGFGFVFQAYNLVPVLTVAENVALPAVIRSERTAAYAARLAEVLEVVGLARHRDKLPAELSGGEQQRVAIARALLASPPLLLADEPTGNLDSVTGAAVLDLLRRAADDGATTVVMVTHDARAAAWGDEVVLLADGAVAGRLRVEGGDRDRRASQVLAWVAAGGVESPPPRAVPRKRGTPVRARAGGEAG